MAPLRRPDLIGASDVAAILGVDPWKSSGDVWARIVHGIQEPAGEPAYWGLALESAIARRFADDHGLVLDSPPSIVAPHGRPWQRVSLDRTYSIRGSVGIVELKTCSRERANGLGAPGSEDVLTEHWIQVQVQMEAVGAPVAHLPYLVAGQDYLEYQVPAAPEVQAAIVEECERFWVDHVVARVPPASSDPSTVARIYPRALRADHRIATTLEADVLERYLAARDARKAAEAEEARLKAAVTSAIGEDRGLRTDDVRATWSECRRIGSPNWQDVAAELARRAGLSFDALNDLARAFPGRDTTYRTLRVTRSRKDGEG